jgi:hypothetical protein
VLFFCVHLCSKIEAIRDDGSLVTGTRFACDDHDLILSKIEVSYLKMFGRTLPSRPSYLKMFSSLI